MRTSFQVRHAMLAPPVTASPRASLETVASLMLDTPTGSVVITGPTGAALGIVTCSNFGGGDDPAVYGFFHSARLYGKAIWNRHSLAEAFADVRKRKVATIMTAPVFTAQPDDELWDAVARMLEHEVTQLPVVEDGRVTGIVTRDSVLGLLARLGPRQPARAAA